jgi:hypothetical protein
MKYKLKKILTQMMEEMQAHHIMITLLATSFLKKNPMKVFFHLLEIKFVVND